MSKSKKILVTGGSGFIGAYFCQLLTDQGIEVVILDLVDPGPEAPHAHLIKGDIRDDKAVRMAMEGCEEIIHMAAAHHDFGIDESTFYDVNETGLRVITNAMDNLGINKITFYSTVAVYGSATPPLTEETMPPPESFYGKSKLEGETAGVKQGRN